MIAVLDENVDSRISEQPRQRAELAGRLLVQPSHDDIPYGHSAEISFGGGLKRECAVVDQVVRDGLAVVGEHTAAFETHSGAAEGLAEVRQCARPVRQMYLEILQVGSHALTTVVVTSTGTDSELAT